MEAAVEGVAARLQSAAERALALMRAQGFEQAQITSAICGKQEVNIAHNEPSLLRSTESPNLTVMGIVDGRKASIELADFERGAALEARIAALRADAESAPADDANAVSSGQRVTIEQGPQQADLGVIRGAARELLEFRNRHATKTIIDECAISHQQRRWRTLTSGGSDIACSIGWYEASVACVARDGTAVSSFDFTGGTADDFRGEFAEHFGIGEMLRSAERQVRARPVGAPFVGDVVLAPNAVNDLIDWLLGQLGDAKLIAGTSLYRNKAGQSIASPLLTLKSRFAAPGVAAVSGDAFVTPPIDVLRAGELRCVLPTLYGSRKTGLPHVPVANGGWELAAGTMTKSQLIEGVKRGALVSRLSMGMPASNGDFSGVIKNSFVIDSGRLGDALSETMISGNVSRMLSDVDGVSVERIDSGSTLLPWVRVPGLHFS